MEISEQQIAKLEARLRALEAIIAFAPQVFTQELFQSVERDMRRRYDHPLAVTDQPRAELKELESEALDEIWRQMQEVPVG